MQRSRYMRVSVVLISLLFLVSACALGDPTNENIFSDVSFQSGVSSYIRREIEGAQSRVKVALNQVVDRSLVMALNDAAARGVSVELVIDSKYEATLAGVSRLVSTKSGNTLGNMHSNFAIVDGTAIFFSDYELTNQSTLAITVRQADLVTTLATEFGQMHDNGAFGSKASGGKAKQQINHQVVFPTASGEVEMYFLPQNRALTFASARMKQARYSVDAYAKYYDNEDLNLDFNDIAGSGRANTFNAGNVNLTRSMRNPFLVANPSNVILSVDLPCNVVFVDAGTPEETLIFTTFPFVSTEDLSKTDGVLLIIRGAGVGHLKSLLDYRMSTLPGYEGPGPSRVDQTIRIASWNMLRLGDGNKNYREAARVIVNGGFDIVGVLELMASSENNNNPSLALSTNVHGPGQALIDVCGAIMNLSPGDWRYHESPSRVGSASYSEYYGYVYNANRIKFEESCGNYPNNANEFTRSPYMARFSDYDTGVTFSYVLQHAIFGSSESLRVAEAANLIRVYRYFRGLLNDQGLDDPIIIAGDFNLPADNPGFSTLYGTVEAITWAIHPETLTTIGDNDFVSAYDNIFYSTLDDRVLQTGRGAYTSWVSATDYSDCPLWASSYSMNNFMYVNRHIADHVPVYITYDTTDRDAQ